MNIEFQFERKLFFLPRQSQNAVIRSVIYKTVGQNFRLRNFSGRNIYPQNVVLVVIKKTAPRRVIFRENQRRFVAFVDDDMKTVFSRRKRFAFDLHVIAKM